MNALIVDDSRAMRCILRRKLEGIDYSVSEAGHGLEAIEQLEVTPQLDLVLVDWNMPEMDGIEFAKGVRGDSHYDALKLVMVTTETEPSRMAQALLSGADEFVMKPFTREILIEKLRLIGAPVKNTAV